MLPTEQCAKILNTEKGKYTDEEIRMIKEFLYQIAKFDIEHFKQTRNEKRKKGNSL